MRRLQYIDHKNKQCRHVILAERAYAAIISEVLKHGKNETGGVLVGNIVNSIWYVIDSLDPGLTTTNTQDFFLWDANYVNHQVEIISLIYHYPVTILGFWHRHPGSMDFFSLTDEDTIRSHLKDSKCGLLSMLVNLDPKLRMTFYYCWEESLFRVGYDVGDEYFPVELLKYATPSRIAENIGTQEAMKVEILPNKVYSADIFPKTISKNSSASENKSAPQCTSEQSKESYNIGNHNEKIGTITNQPVEILQSNLLAQQRIINTLRQEKASLEKKKQELERVIEHLNEQVQSMKAERERNTLPERDAEKELEMTNQCNEMMTPEEEISEQTEADQKGTDKDGTE